MTRRYAGGSVYHRSRDDRWVGAAHVKGKRRVVYGSNKAEAQRKLTDLQAALQAGVVPADRRLSVGRHLQQWLESKRHTVRPSTWESYEGHVRIHLASVKRVPLVGLTPNDVRELVKNRLGEGCAPQTVANTLTVLRMALKQAMRDGLVTRNVALLADAPTVPRPEMRIPALAEVHLLLDLESQYQSLWTLMAGTGLREGEALGLRHRDVDFSAGTLTVNVALRVVPRHARPAAPKWSRTAHRLQLVEPKTDAARRTLALPARVDASLREHMEESAFRPANVNGLFFTTPKGTPLDPRNTSRAFQKDREAAGLPSTHLHHLRHFYVSQMLAVGATLHDVMRALGHSSIVTTIDTYGHLVEGRSRELATAMDRLLG